MPDQFFQQQQAFGPQAYTSMAGGGASADFGGGVSSPFGGQAYTSMAGGPGGASADFGQMANTSLSQPSGGFGQTFGPQAYTSMAGGGASANASGLTANQSQISPGGGPDPFAYTKGSLLTPWDKKFEWGGGTAGGYTPPDIKKFEYGNFNYSTPEIGRFADKAPTAERYKDFAFDFQQDPMAQQAYKFRTAEGQRAMQNSAAARGTLLSGSFAKALQNYGQEAASQEYGNAYNRALTSYGTNRDTAQQHFGNQMATYGGNLNRFQANAQAALGEGNLGLQAATAGWDRNYQLARTQWQDEADAAQRAASAAASNSSLSYNQALQQYKMEHDIFQENQGNQFNRLMAMSQLGMQGAGMAGQYGSAYANNAGSIYGQQGNAGAAGSMGAANAWMQGMSNAGNTLMGAYYGNQRPLSSYW